MITGRRERVRWLVPALVAVVALGAPGVVAADGNVAPSVTATVANANPAEPQTVVASATFTDPESAIETYTCSIDYGDGPVVAGVVSGLTCAGPAHQYNASGSYTVKVAVTDNVGASGVGITGAAYKNTAPWVGGLGLVGTVRVGSTSHAVTAVVDPGQSVETYICTSIDYGDWTPLQAGTWVPTGWSDGLPRCVFPDHVYATSGSYRLTAVVTDSGGASGSASFIETISPANPPNAAPTVSAVMSDYNPREWHLDPSVPSAVTASATFTDPESSSETYTCTIDYGDGTVVAGVVSGLTCTGPTHQYLVSGTYSVTVTVTDSGGATGTGTSGATYQNWAPWVGGGLVGSFVVGSPVHDVAAIVDPGAAFETYTCTVDYGDGSGVQGGTYVRNGWSDGLPRCVGPDHIYNAPGSYSIVTTATDSAGETGSSMVIETIIASSVVVGPVSLPYAFEVGVPVSASATFGEVVGRTYTCTVDYGDGGGAQPGTIDGSTCVGPSHTYIQDYYYTVTVRVIDSNGGVGTSSVDIGLSNIGPSITGLTFNPGPSLDGSPVRLVATFTDPGMAANPPETYTCNVYYGDSTGGQDGIVSGNQCIGPAHIFPGLGPYPVTVIVQDSNGGGDYATIDITLLNIAPVVTGYGVTTFGQSGIEEAALATFSDPGSAPGTPPETYACTIDYGDGAGPQPGVIAGSICTGPDHTYASKGTYTFVATVTDSNGGVGTYTIPIEIYNPWPIVGAVSAPASTTVGTAVTASAAYVSTGLVPADTCTVDYGDGTGPLAGTADGAICTGPSHNYASVGTFTITVMILATLSTASSSATIQVYSLQVGAVSVSGTLTEGSWVAASATFTPTGRQTYKCTVNYGDGAGAQVGTISSTTCRGPSHKYAMPGDYTIRVAVTGSKGYSGSASVAVSVENAAPGSVTPSFAQTMLKLGSTATLTVRFVDPGIGETYTGLVYWGDGTQSAVTVTGATRQFSISHRYAGAGCYYVWASVTEPDGRGEMVPVPTLPNAPDASIVIYDPARTVSGSGKLTSPSDACLLTKACQVASTASFSLNARYAAGATKPTVSFSYTAAGFSFTATSADLLVASQGRLTIRGAGKVNGVSGFSFLLVAWDGNPDTLWLAVENARTGQTIYQGVEGQPLLSGSISIR